MLKFEVKRMNKSGNENRSVRNTKARLYEALMYLMREKPINTISVKELTEMADVNRGTFYFHYSDVYTMLSSIEDDFFSELSEVMSSSTPTTRDAGAHYLAEIFRFVGQNREFCSILLGENGDMQFFRRITEFVEEKCAALWRILIPGADERSFKMYNSFIISGCIGLIRFWLDDNLRETPEAISRVAVSLISAGLSSANRV